MAAPQDTITIREPGSSPVQTPIGTIASKFRVYWAGSDRDGDVVGFYWAVVETIPIPPPGLRLPPLPGPKPQDYHFTTRTDSTFIFTVSEQSPDRQHAFFVYSVDDGGKPDPTPARVIFNALDRFPPLPIIECAGSNTFMRGTGPIYTQVAAGIFQRDTTIYICDSLNIARAPLDTIPQSARIDIKWRGEPTIGGTYITGFRYKLDEPEFNAVDSSVTTASYNTGVGPDVVRPGTKIFTLRAVDQSGGMREINRYFQLNFAPDSWFSGPDLNQPIYTVSSTERDKGRYYEVTDWRALPGFPGSLLSCDSLTTWPGERPARKTFFEIYDPDGAGPLKDRIYARAEGDTVHMNSWVLVHGGGRDLDSPYLVKVTDFDRSRDTVVCGTSKTLRPGPPNGSPIGYHVFFPNRLTAGPVSSPAQSGILPIFDAADVLNSPRIGGYEGFRRSGRVFAVIRADDGNGYDGRIGSRPDRIVDRVENGTGTPEDEALRSLIMTFYVNRAPYLITGDAAFVPKQGQTFPTRRLDLNLMGADDDPLDPDTAPPVPGGPSTNTLLRWNVRVKGLGASGDTVVVVATPDEGAFTPNITVNLPSTIVSTQVLVLVEICDCARCEIVPGQGRCVNYVFTVNVPSPSPDRAAAEDATVGPGPTHSLR